MKSKANERRRVKTKAAKPYYTTVEVAERLGVCDTRVRQMIAEKKIRANRLGPRSWMITGAELARVVRLREGAPT